MPIYEYSCEACGHIFEHFTTSMRKRTSPGCPKCGRDNTRKLISVFAPSNGKATDEVEGCGMTEGGVCRKPGCRFAE